MIEFVSGETTVKIHHPGFTEVIHEAREVPVPLDVVSPGEEYVFHRAVDSFKDVDVGHYVKWRDPQVRLWQCAKVTTVNYEGPVVVSVGVVLNMGPPLEYRVEGFQVSEVEFFDLLKQCTKDERKHINAAGYWLIEEDSRQRVELVVGRCRHQGELHWLTPSGDLIRADAGVRLEQAMTMQEISDYTSQGKLPVRICDE